MSKVLSDAGKWAAALWVCLILGSCQENTDAPDVSHINVDIEIVRTDQVLFDVPDKSAFEAEILHHKDFYDIYLDKVLSLRVGSDSSYYENFVGYTSDSLFIDVREKAGERFSNMDKIQSDLKKMYQYFEYYFPQTIVVPKFYTFIADFAYQLFIFSDSGEDAMGIGLDMFLHPEIKYKLVNPDNTFFSDYVTRSWNQHHMVQKIASWHISDLIGEPPGHRLIDHMIYNGKMLYLSKKILPWVQDSVIHDYTPDQLQWCEENQYEMWQFFLENKLFYETNLKKISSYINPSPASIDMPPSAPGRTANYLGYKIVESYMRRYPETTLEKLLSLTDSQMILDKSKYRPRRI